MAAPLVKISNLFNDSIKICQLLTTISKISPIAGGAVCYALCDFVPAESVGDVDIFINSDEKLEQVLKLIEQYYPDATYWIPTNRNACSNPYAYENAALTVKIGDNHPLQLIRYDYLNIVDLITYFDMDYIQCAYYDGKITTTSICDQAHKNKKIRYISPKLRFGRLLKAVKKGFNCPILCNALENIIEYSQVPGKFASSKGFLSPMNNSDLPHFDLSIAEIVGFQLTRSIYGGGRLGTGKFIIESNGEYIYAYIVSVEIDIVKRIHLSKTESSFPNTVVINKCELTQLANNTYIKCKEEIEPINRAVLISACLYDCHMLRHFKIGKYVDITSIINWRRHDDPGDPPFICYTPPKFIFRIINSDILCESLPFSNKIMIPGDRRSSNIIYHISPTSTIKKQLKPKLNHNIVNIIIDML